MRIIKRIIKYFIAYLNFIKDYARFKKANDGRFDVYWKNIKPLLFDKTPKISFDTHYILHPAWAARILSQKNRKNILIFHQV